MSIWRGQRFRAPLFLLVLASLFLVANRGAYFSFFEDDDMEALGFASKAPPLGFARETFSIHFGELNTRSAGYFFYQALSRLAGVRFGPFVAALHAIHLAGVFCIWLLLRKLAFTPFAAGAGTLFYTFHAATFDAYWRPMYVYDVMCGVFCLLSLLCYAHRRWVLSFLFFWLGIRSKELAIMLPAVLLCYEFLIGDRRWKRLVPFLACSLYFGLIGAVLSPHAATETYRFSVAPAEIWRTVSFYSSQILAAPWLGLAIPAAALFWEDRRYRLGAAAVCLLIFPMLFFPGRVASVYLYSALAGGAIGMAAVASRLPTPVVVGFFLLWLPLNYQQLRVKRHALLAATDVCREYFQTIQRFPGALPPNSVFYYDDTPEHMRPWGIRAALELVYRSDVDLRPSDSPLAPDARPAALLSWEPLHRRFSTLVSGPGARPFPYLQMKRLMPIWQLTDGWLPLDGSARWTRSRVRVRLWRPAEARYLELIASAPPDTLKENGRVSIRVTTNGMELGRHDYTRPGSETVRWKLAPAPARVVDLEWTVDPPTGGEAGDQLGVAVIAVGFLPDLPQ